MPRDFSLKRSLGGGERKKNQTKIKHQKNPTNKGGKKVDYTKIHKHRNLEYIIKNLTIVHLFLKAS